jgi:hypothetical protein
VTVRDNDTALKLFLKYDLLDLKGTYTVQNEATAETCYEYLQREKEVYRRLDHDDDIVFCLDLSGMGI